MSVDKSLKIRSALARTRSVLSRAERLAELKEAGKWDEMKSVYGLPKVRVRKAKRKPKVAKAETAEAAAAAPGAAAPGAAPAAAAPAAKGAPAAKAPAAKPAAKK